MDYIILSIPAFFILIGVELLISKLRKTQLYRFNDAVTNMSCGITQQITVAFAKTVLFGIYAFIFENYRLFEIPATWWTWVLLFVGIDFFYYWFHRLSHEINIFWGAHIVHHQSEEYNLSVALRQSALQGFISMIFYLPLAIIGFNPIAFVTVNSFQTLYQFWIHTKLINKLHPAFEFVFNTPSHHRVHHGRNPKYIDRNHGGTLILFDRIFGTFQKEEEEVVYGVTKPLASWNPVWANVDYYNDLWKSLKQPMRWSERLNMIWAYPGWRPKHLGGMQDTPEVRLPNEVYDTSIPARLNYYILFQFAVVLAVTTMFLFWMQKFSVTQQVTLSVWILVSVASLGGLFELRRWSWYLECTRLVGLALFCLTLSQVGIALPAASILFAGTGTVIMFRFKPLFKK